MTRLLQRFSRNVGRGDSTRLTLLLLLVVLAPSICLLWFMNQAVQNERLALRQKLGDALRAQLAAAQQQLESYWKQTAQELDSKNASLPPSIVFENLIRSNLADGVLCFDASNLLTYPNPAGPTRIDTPSFDWEQARALERTDPTAAAARFAAMAQEQTDSDLAACAFQSQVRCLARAGQKEAALAVVTGPLTETRFHNARDFEGRLVVPNARLMALQLVKDSNSNSVQLTIVDQLKTSLLDYSNTNLPAGQRRFLIGEFTKLFPKQASFPTLEAENLTAEFLETFTTNETEPGLHSTPLQDVWRFDSASGRVVTLHRTPQLLARMAKAVSFDSSFTDMSVMFLPPGDDSRKAFLSVPAGAFLPGWRVALLSNERQGPGNGSVQRVSTYIWIAALMVATVTALGLLALSLVRRQMSLTRLRNDLVANVTHELKTPLASMRLLVDTLLDSKSLDEVTARDYLQLIARENSRLSRLIDNFLAFSRMERNKRAFDFTEVSAAKIATDADAAVRERFSVPGCHFTLQLPPELPTVTADPDAMVTALVNLLDNAYKYSGEQKEIVLSAEAENGNVLYSVSDNGIGLPARETKRIFDRFYQVDQRTSQATGGCGLGLSIVKFIVTAHHGEVQVQSEPGKGSTFKITLPLHGVERE